MSLRVTFTILALAGAAACSARAPVVMGGSALTVEAPPGECVIDTHRQGSSVAASPERAMEIQHPQVQIASTQRVTVSATEVVFEVYEGSRKDAAYRVLRAPGAGWFVTQRSEAHPCDRYNEVGG